MSHPSNVGIKALEIYFPSMYVDQDELEVFDNVSKGKYTIGLGQTRMGFCSDLEDVNSLALTVTHRLVENHSIDLSKIGFLCVGSETLIDKSKSTKSVLMEMFLECGNFDVEGVDCKNACYGGTAALFHAFDWIESSSWDGRLALVVAADIAVYAQEGSARCTGGAGAIAMLVGPDAPIVMERGLRSSFMQHHYDFYKPDFSSEYPTVDGPNTVRCYISSLDNCYRTYKTKSERLNGEEVSVNSFDFCCFHAPFSKLVQKSFGRLVYLDHRQLSGSESSRFSPFLSMSLEDTYSNKDLERLCVEATKGIFASKCEPSLFISRNVGNMYTSSLYSCLISVLATMKSEKLTGSRILMFSYGSGLASSMFSLRVTSDTALLKPLLTPLQNIPSQLNERHKISPDDYTRCMKLREDCYQKAPYQPGGDVDLLGKGVFHLTDIDQMYRRVYCRTNKM